MEGCGAETAFKFKTQKEIGWQGYKWTCMNHEERIQHVKVLEFAGFIKNGS